jgi:hypothetical protein
MLLIGGEVVVVSTYPFLVTLSCPLTFLTSNLLYEIQVRVWLDGVIRSLLAMEPGNPNFLGWVI